MNAKNLSHLILRTHNFSFARKYIKFGPDGRLYINVGAPCNTCLRMDKRYASIMRQVMPDSNKFDIFAFGVRNTVGYDFHPVVSKLKFHFTNFLVLTNTQKKKTGELWFTENGRDWYNETWPPDEINRAPVQGLHFGFPFYYGHNSRDVEVRYPPEMKREEYTPSVYNLEAHVAVLGAHFYRGNMFPPKYKNALFAAEHGNETCFLFWRHNFHCI